MKNYLTLFIVFSIFMISCTNTNDKKQNARADLKKQENISKVSQEDSYRLPPLPSHIYNEIFKYGDFLDVIFEDLEFSMSQENNTSIRSFLQNINLKMTTPIKSSCKPMGHAVFLKNGTNIIEADFYHGSGCYYFVFMYEGEEPMYSNSMSSIGKTFFNNLKNRNFKQN